MEAEIAYLNRDLVPCREEEEPVQTTESSQESQAPNDFASLLFWMENMAV